MAALQKERIGCCFGHIQFGLVFFVTPNLESAFFSLKRKIFSEPTLPEGYPTDYLGSSV